MGLQCSKDATHQTEANHASGAAVVGSGGVAGALESDPRSRRRRAPHRMLLSSNSAAHNSNSNNAKPALNSHAHGNSSHALSGNSTGLARMDPALFALQQQSMAQFQQICSNHNKGDILTAGQFHLLYKQQQRRQQQQQHSQVSASLSSSAQTPKRRRAGGNSSLDPAGAHATEDDLEVPLVEDDDDDDVDVPPPEYTTRLVVRRHTVRPAEEGLSGTHIFALRWHKHRALQLNSGSGANSSSSALPEQSPASLLRSTTSSRSKSSAAGSSSKPVLPPPMTRPAPTTTTTSSHVMGASNITVSPPFDSLFHPATLAQTPARQVHDWVTVSEEHNIYVADVGLSAAECNELIQVTEQVCRGQYAAYTYAKQTLGCREFPVLAQAVAGPVHTAVHAILQRAAHTTTHLSASSFLALDDREPHMVKYDVTKRERQKLDMHTDKSEWTFLIALSNGCGMDYEGGGTYFECIDATLHIQRGHVLVFPGKLRHCGQRITSGLRFLLVGFLVEKSVATLTATTSSNHGNAAVMTTKSTLDPPCTAALPVTYSNNHRHLHLLDDDMIPLTNAP